METKTAFIAAAATPARFAKVTGLVNGRGFTLHQGHPGGLYPESSAVQIREQLTDAGIDFVSTPAQTINEGRRRAGLGD